MSYLSETEKRWDARITLIVLVVCAVLTVLTVVGMSRTATSTSVPADNCMSCAEMNVKGSIFGYLKRGIS